MTDDDGNITTDATAGNGTDNLPQIGLLTQYIKDMSVENPNAPDSYNWDTQPQIDVQVNIAANNVGNDLHEVELKLGVKASTDKGVSFAVELVYCGLFGIRNVPEEQVHPFLYAEGPRLVFPFARRILADAVRDCGYAPLLLDPIDFNSLYLQQRAQADAVATGTPAGNA